MEKISNKINIGQLASMFGITAFDDLLESNFDYIHDSGLYVYNEAISNGCDESTAEDKRYTAEDSAQTALFEAWHRAVMTAVSALFAAHGLKLEPIKVRRKVQDKYPSEFRILPIPAMWGRAADLIRETINGVGYFHFNNLREFLSSGPYTARQCVLYHLHWIPKYSMFMEIIALSTDMKRISRQIRVICR